MNSLHTQLKSSYKCQTIVETQGIQTNEWTHKKKKPLHRECFKMSSCACVLEVRQGEKAKKPSKKLNLFFSSLVPFIVIFGLVLDLPLQQMCFNFGKFLCNGQCMCEILFFHGVLCMSVSMVFARYEPFLRSLPMSIICFVFESQCKITWQNAKREKKHIVFLSLLGSSWIMP